MLDIPVLIVGGGVAGCARPPRGPGGPMGRRA